ncbi:uncharacterized protein Fot_16879 [Forsythia ovata]|uniref:Uncharacterized protein n=1 Tax=Forsythia ovata TaxID=205694 RepID=A0ABD1VFW0_9LAMI
MKKNLKAVNQWKLLVLVLELSSLHTEIAYRDGAMKRETQLVKFVYRGSLEVPRREPEQENAVQILDSECASAADRSASCCRSVAVIFTVLLLIRYLLAVLTRGTGDYPFSLLTLIIVKAGGVLLPMYILIRMITAIQSSIRHQYQNSDNDMSSSDDEEEVDVQQHDIEIQT